MVLTKLPGPDAAIPTENEFRPHLSAPVGSRPEIPKPTLSVEHPQDGALSAQVSPFGELNALLSDGTAAASELRKSKIRDWAEVDPAGAGAWAAAVKDASARADALEQVAIIWANSDLQAAARWVGSLPEDRAKETAAIAFAYESARSDPVTAVQIAGSLPESRARDEAITHAVSQWAANDSASAFLWSRQVAGVQLQQQLFSAIAIAASDEAPSTAAKLAASFLEPGASQSSTAVSIVQRWAQTSPETAADWIVQFPEGADRVSAVDNLVTIWALKDAPAAQSWAESLPEGSLHDAALSAWNQAIASLGNATN